jgi:DNA-binding MarR family transcriptional regulator
MATAGLEVPALDPGLAGVAEAWENFVRALRYARARNRDRSHGLTLSQYELLRPLLDETEGIPVGRLAEYAGVTAASATGALDALEDAGVVDRTRPLHDRRHVTISLTAAGREQVERKHLDLDGKRRLFFATLAPAEREQAERTLRHLADLIEVL